MTIRGKHIGLFILSVLMVILIYLNASMHVRTSIKDTEQTSKDIHKQLIFLKTQLHEESLGKRMQLLFPEGFMFTNALYGISWIELAKHESTNTDLHQMALTESRYAFQQMNSDYAKANFDIHLPLSYGVFYRGWRNYLLAKILSLQTEKDSTELEIFQQECEEMAIYFSKQQSPYPESYPGSAWPADAFVAMASLKLHDDISTPLYTSYIEQWLKKVNLYLDNKTGMIPHSVNAMSCETIEGARGSSMSLMLRFLVDIDPKLALQQFNLFQEKFGSSICGLNIVREFQHGKISMGDVDSGPVIAGMGPSATLVGAGTYIQFGETDLADQILRSASTFGMSYTNTTSQKYLFGQLPIADAFIVWSKLQHENEEINKLKSRNVYRSNSIWIFHSISLCLMIMLGYGIKRMW